jgi:redox-sensing transcriptional repressor
MMGFKSVSTQTLQRLPLYLNYLKSLPKDGSANISATTIADALHLNDVQVRKDLASVSTGGRPKIGYITEDLICEIERFLGYDGSSSAVLVGVGNLGRALLSYNGFFKYGLDIVAAFDSDMSVIGTSINGKRILPAEKLKDICSRLKIRTGIIAVPALEAQKACNILVEGGVLAVWNFAPVHLTAPGNVLVKNENMASSLAVLSKHLTGKLNNI